MEPFNAYSFKHFEVGHTRKDLIFGPLPIGWSKVTRNQSVTFNEAAGRVVSTLRYHAGRQCIAEPTQEPEGQCPRAAVLAWRGARRPDLHLPLLLLTSALLIRTNYLVYASLLHFHVQIGKFHVL